MSEQIKNNSFKPKLKLVGEDGNAFFILGRAINIARHSGWSEEKIDTFKKAATSGDYDNLLAVCMDYFDVDSEESEDEEEDTSLEEE